MCSSLHSRFPSTVPAISTLDAERKPCSLPVEPTVIVPLLFSWPSIVPLSRMSRAEYSHLATKSTTGKPNQFYINKTLSPTITVWPQPDKNSTYTIYVNVLTRMDDAGGGANSLQMPFRFYPCLTAGLSYYLALKKAPEKVQMLKQLYEEEFTRALSQDEERASFRVAPDLRSYNIA